MSYIVKILHRHSYKVVKLQIWWYNNTIVVGNIIILKQIKQDTRVLLNVPFLHVGKGLHVWFAMHVVVGEDTT